MSSKYAGAQAGKELLFFILKCIDSGVEVEKPAHKKRIYYLQRRGYVARNQNGHYLTSEGKGALNEDQVWNLSIPTPNTWDKKWRFVLFDIPVDKHRRRDAFRLRLKELGLVLYQNSVWVYPYPLEDTVRQIADFYKLSKCVSFVTAEKVSGEQKLRKHFRIRI